MNSGGIQSRSGGHTRIESLWPCLTVVQLASTRSRCPFLRLRGAGEETDSSIEDYMHGMLEDQQDDYDNLGFVDPRALRYLPGNEDLPPHPSEVGWNSDWYTQRGIDLSQGFMRYRGDHGVARTPLEISDHEASEVMAMMKRVHNNRTAMEEELIKDLEPELEKEAGSSMTLAPDDTGFVTDSEKQRLAEMPVAEMRRKHWDAMSDEQLMERYERVYEDFKTCIQENTSSVLFDKEWVLQGDDEDEVMQRLLVSALGLEEAVGHVARFHDLLAGAPMRELDEKMVTAAQDGDARQVAFWIRRGANVSAVDTRVHKNLTALHYAAELGHASTCSTLLAHGADPLHREKWEARTPLHLAASQGHTAAVRALVEGGTPVDVENRRGRTALHDACARGQTSTARVLLDLGADVNRRYAGVTLEVTAELRAAAGACGGEEFGELFRRNGEMQRVRQGRYATRRGSLFANSEASALHDAAEWGFEGTCRMLLQRGARVFITDADGRTPRERAEERMTCGDEDDVRIGTVRLLRAWEEGGDGEEEEEDDSEDAWIEEVEEEAGGGAGRRTRRKDAASLAVHPKAGRIGRDGEWEDYENYNGLALKESERNGTHPKFRTGFPLLRRGVRLRQRAMEGRRKAGLDNPGLTPNWGSEYPSSTETLEQLLGFLLWPKADLEAARAATARRQARLRRRFEREKAERARGEGGWTEEKLRRAEAEWRGWEDFPFWIPTKEQVVPDDE